MGLFQGSGRKHGRAAQALVTAQWPGQVWRLHRTRPLKLGSLREDSGGSWVASLWPPSLALVLYLLVKPWPFAQRTRGPWSPALCIALQPHSPSASVHGHPDLCSLWARTDAPALTLRPAGPVGSQRLLFSIPF